MRSGDEVTGLIRLDIVGKMKRDRSGHILVAQNARVLRSNDQGRLKTIRLRFVEANGTYHPEKLRWTDAPNVSTSQGIHNLK